MKLTSEEKQAIYAKATGAYGTIIDDGERHRFFNLLDIHTNTPHVCLWHDVFEDEYKVGEFVWDSFCQQGCENLHGLLQIPINNLFGPLAENALEGYLAERFEAVADDESVVERRVEAARELNRFKARRPVWYDAPEVTEMTPDLQLGAFEMQRMSTGQWRLQCKPDEPRPRVSIDETFEDPRRAEKWTLEALRCIGEKLNNREAVEDNYDIKHVTSAAYNEVSRRRLKNFVKSHRAN